MDFVEKIIADTGKGDWDFFWKYTDGASTYSITKPKHYLSGLNFSLEKDETLITFPNGYGLMCPKEQLQQLRDEINLSLERTVDECIALYLAGKEMTPEQEALAKKESSVSGSKVETSGSATTSGSKTKVPAPKKSAKK